MGGNQDLLNVTAFFSALVHAVVILGVSFKLPEIADINNTDNSLDVVLISAFNDIEPEDTEIISSADTQGGGTHDLDPSTLLPYKVVSPSPIDSIQKSADQQPQSTLSPDQLISAESAALKVAKEAPDTIKLKATEKSKGADLITTKSPRQLEKERLAAKISRNWQEYLKRPNKLFLSPSTKQHDAAEYLDSWRKLVERVGNANYPEQAQAKSLSGTLELTVEINRNGTINKIQINRPSNHKLLDDATIRFVRDASPYPPIPDHVSPDKDIIVISRAFHFLDGNRLSSSDASSTRTNR